MTHLLPPAAPTPAVPVRRLRDAIALRLLAVLAGITISACASTTELYSVDESDVDAALVHIAAASWNSAIGYTVLDSDPSGARVLIDHTETCAMSPCGSDASGCEREDPSGAADPLDGQIVLCSGLFRSVPNPDACVRTVALHEFGHRLGLEDHRPMPSIMSYHAQCGDEPSAADIAAVREIMGL